MPTEADLIREGLPVVEAVSKRVARRLGRLVHVDDLRSIAKIALYDVARSYDPDRAAFATYAAAKLKWAILDEVRRQTHGRSATARLNAVMASERFGDAFDTECSKADDEPPAIEDWQARLSAMLEGHAAALAVGLAQSRTNVLRLADAQVNPEEEAARAELSVRLRQLVEALPDRQRALIERHYYKGELFEAIAEDLGISKSWASRLHERAITQLGKALRELR
jgi:RNA polymerase sigma factor for flagellar operon FliA